MHRRKFIKSSTASLFALPVGTGVYSFFIEPFWLEFKNVEMSFNHLPESLIGKTLMQISDLHVGVRFDHKYLIKSFIEAQKLAPEFVVYTQHD